MNRKLIRVGDEVYDGNVLVAAWMRGAWYKPKREKGQIIWEHVEPSMGAEDAKLVDGCEKARIR